MTVSAIDGEWTEHQSTRTRALQPTEQLLNSPVGSESWPVSFMVRLDLGTVDRDDFVERLKQSWSKLLINNPLSTAVVENFTKFTSKVISSEKDLEEWLKLSFVVQSANGSCEQFLSNLNLPTRATLFWLNDCDTLIFSCPHTHIDGIGALHIVDRLLNDATSSHDLDPWQQNEEHFLSPSLESVLGGPPNELDTKIAIDSLTQYGMAQPQSLGDQPCHIADTPGKTQWSKVVLTKIQTTQVVESCKKLGVSVTAAVHAAVIQALRGYKINENITNYTTFAVIGMRDIMPQPIASALFGMYFGFWPMALNVQGTFEELVKTTNDFYVKQKNELKENQSGNRNSVLAVSQIAVSSFQKNAQNPAEMRHNPAISSVGKIDHILKKSYGPATITSYEEYTVTGSPQIPWLVWSFDGMLHLNGSYNDAYYDQEYITNMEHSIINALLSLDKS